MLRKFDTFKQFKYKKILRLRDNTITNTRILKFNRPKWRFIKWKINNNFYKLGTRRRFWARRARYRYFYHQLGYKIPLKWSRMRFYFRSSLIAKARLFFYFSLRLRISQLKKLISKKNKLSLLKNLESRPDIILWRAGFFPTTGIARFVISHNKVYLNDKKINKHSIYLKEGDILGVDSSVFKFIENLWKRFYIAERHNKKFFTMGHRWKKVYPMSLEINWDLLQIVYLFGFEKNFSSYYMHRRFLNIPKVIHYLRLK